MGDFKTWYEKKYGSYPGMQGEEYHKIFERMAEAFSEYIDEVVAKMRDAK